MFIYSIQTVCSILILWSLILMRWILCSKYSSRQGGARAQYRNTVPRDSIYCAMSESVTKFRTTLFKKLYNKVSRDSHRKSSGIPAWHCLRLCWQCRQPTVISNFFYNKVPRDALKESSGSSRKLSPRVTMHTVKQNVLYTLSKFYL
jgi:hypothetical protein